MTLLLRVIAGATFFLALCPNLAGATGIGSSRDLIGMCTSARAEDVAYCEGYIEGAAYIWKFRTACEPSLEIFRSYCSGLESAREKILEAYEACTDCPAPALKQDRAYRDRMRKFRDELKATMGVCSPDSEHDGRYCDGYNAEVNKELADISLFHDSPHDPRSRGLGEGSFQADAAVFVTADFFAFTPCVNPKLGGQEMKEILLRFVGDNSEQQRDEFPIMLLEKALFYGACPGPQLGLKPNVEHCTEWGYDRNEYVAKNTCDRPVVVRLQSAGEQAIEGQVKPRQTFRTGLMRLQIEAGSWLYTVCPVGHVSSVPFSPEHAKTIRASHYSCVRK